MAPEPITTSDRELVSAAQSGDRAALERLLERYQPTIYRFGRKMCANEDDAREVLQETLLSAARNLGGFRGEASLTTWLYQIARSFCIKRRRRSQYAPQHELSLEGEGRGAERVVDQARRPDEAVLARELAQALDRAIDQLEPMYREVLLLRDVEGLTAPEVAAVLGIRVAAVKSRLHRARQSVRAMVSAALDDTGAPPPAPGCPDVVELLSRELEGEISPTLCAQMEQHLSGCPGCRGRCDGMRRVLAVCAATPAPAVPPEVRDALRRAVRALLDAP